MRRKIPTRWSTTRSASGPSSTLSAGAARTGQPSAAQVVGALGEAEGGDDGPGAAAQAGPGRVPDHATADAVAHDDLPGRLGGFSGHRAGLERTSALGFGPTRWARR